MRKIAAVAVACLVTFSCSETPPKSTETSAPAATAAPPNIVAEMIASDPTWGNTEGPAVDSKGNLFFCSRGAFKGIVSWNQKDGAHQFVSLDKKFGPGGLWIDDADNIYATGVGDRVIWKVTPTRKSPCWRKASKRSPDTATGPNDLMIAPNKSIYFTDPNGFDGSCPVGTIYRLSPGRQSDGL